VLHKEAGGQGTFAARSRSRCPGHEGAMAWQPGTKFYLSSVQRYVIVEDSGAAKQPAGTDTHLDMWIGGQDGTKQATDDCGEHLHRQGAGAGQSAGQPAGDGRPRSFEPGSAMCRRRPPTWVPNRTPAAATVVTAGVTPAAAGAAATAITTTATTGNSDSGGTAGGQRRGSLTEALLDVPTRPRWWGSRGPERLLFCRRSGMVCRRARRGGVYPPAGRRDAPRSGRGDARSLIGRR